MNDIETLQSAKTEHNDKNDFVYRTLSEHSNRTEQIVQKLIEQAIVAPNPITGVGATGEDEQAFRERCSKMACKFLWMLANSERTHGKGQGWVPTKSCVDLTTLGAALTPDEERMSLEDIREKWNIEDLQTTGRARKRTPRQFKVCSGCGKRFLAKRANNLTCSVRCRRRASRMSQITCNTPLKAA